MRSLRETAAGDEPKGTKSTIKFALRTPRGRSIVWVVVEDVDDAVVYERFLDKDKTKIYPSTDEMGYKGCANVERIVSEIKLEEADALIFGIRDTDYTKYESVKHVFPEDIFVTDCRDIEMMMLEAPSVQNALKEWNSCIPDMLERGEHIARIFGYMRICNHLKGLGCNFRHKVRIASVWDCNSHSFCSGWESLVVKSFIDNCNKPFTELEFRKFVYALNLENEPKYNVCQGHDVLALLQYMMVETGIYNKKSIRDRMVAAYSRDDFSQTKLCKSIYDWSLGKKVSILN